MNFFWVLFFSDIFMESIWREKYNLYRIQHLQFWKWFTRTLLWYSAYCLYSHVSLRCSLYLEKAGIRFREVANTVLKKITTIIKEIEWLAALSWFVPQSCTLANKFQIKETSLFCDLCKISLSHVQFTAFSVYNKTCLLALYLQSPLTLVLIISQSSIKKSYKCTVYNLVAVVEILEEKQYSLVKAKRAVVLPKSSIWIII